MEPNTESIHPKQTEAATEPLLRSDNQCHLPWKLGFQVAPLEKRGYLIMEFHAGFYENWQGGDANGPTENTGEVPFATLTQADWYQPAFNKNEAKNKRRHHWVHRH